MDYEYWLRIGLENKPIVINEPLAGFRRIEGTKSNTNYRVQFLDDLRVGVRAARKRGRHWTIPFKALSYARTVMIYPFLYK